MKQVEVSVDIDRPASEVFDYLNEVSNSPKWLKSAVSCMWTTDPPVRVGSRYEQVAQFMGKEMCTSYDVVAYEAGHLITVKSAEGSSFPLTMTRQVDPIDDNKCRLVAIVEIDSGQSTPAPMRAMMARNMKRDYRSLKRLLEHG